MSCVACGLCVLLFLSFYAALMIMTRITTTTTIRINVLSGERSGVCSFFFSSEKNVAQRLCGGGVTVVTWSLE